MHELDLVSQPQVRGIFGGISDMTIWRWRQAGILPEPITIRNRNFWRTTVIAKVQQRFERASAA